MERRLAAILAADMVGYSRLMATDEQAAIGRLKEQRSLLIDPRITQYGGRIVKTTGDRFLTPSHTPTGLCQKIRGLSLLTHRHI